MNSGEKISLLKVFLLTVVTVHLAEIVDYGTVIIDFFNGSGRSFLFKVTGAKSLTQTQLFSFHNLVKFPADFGLSTSQTHPAVMAIFGFFFCSRNHGCDLSLTILTDLSYLSTLSTEV